MLAEATTQPRWPMYPRQFKQFLRVAQPDFDERRYGSIADLMRACQKDGLLRLERDRQGVLRVFAGGSPRASVPHGWGTRDNGPEVSPEPMAVLDVVPEEVAAPVVEAEITAIVDEAPAPKAKRASRAKKSAAKSSKGAKSSKSSKGKN